MRPPLSTTPPSLQLRLQARPESARLLRQRLALWLDELDATNKEIFELSLASTEAFANAVEHPHEPTDDMIEVDGTITDRTLTITVCDHGSWRPQRQLANRGLGLPLIRKLMATVEIHTEPKQTMISMQRTLARKPLH